MSPKLKKDLSGIGTRLSWNWQIVLKFWCCIGIDMDCHWIDTRLASDWIELTLDWHRISAELTLDCNQIGCICEICNIGTTIWAWYFDGLKLDWHLIFVGLTDWLKLGTWLTVRLILDGKPGRKIVIEKKSEDPRETFCSFFDWHCKSQTAHTCC